MPLYSLAAFPNGTAAAPGFRKISEITSGFYGATGLIGAAILGASVMTWEADLVSQVNGTTAQKLRVFKTGNAANGEWGTFDWASIPGYLLIGSQKAGTGAARPVIVGSNPAGSPDDALFLQGTEIRVYGTTNIRIFSGGVETFKLDSTGLLCPTDNTYDIGASGATSPRSIYFGTSLFRGAVKLLGAQGAAVADASGGAVQDTEGRAAINALLARLRTHGVIAT